MRGFAFFCTSTLIGVSGDNFGVEPTLYTVPGILARDVAVAFPAPLAYICDRDIAALCDACGVVAHNHTYLTCLTPAGIGARKFVKVVTNQLSNDVSNTGAHFGYHGPVIMNLSAYSANTGPDKLGVFQTINITGQYFGSPTEIARVISANGAALPQPLLLYVGHAAHLGWVRWCCCRRRELP